MLRYDVDPPGNNRARRKRACMALRRGPQCRIQGTAPPSDRFEISGLPLDISKCEEIEVDNAHLFGLKAYSKSLKRFIEVAVWYPNEADMTKWRIYFSTDESMRTKDVIDCYCKHQYRRAA